MDGMDETHKMEHWYALYTKPQSERRAARSLHDRGLEVFLPIVRQRYGREWREEPLFRCYLFLRADLQAVGTSAVQWTPGLRHIVAFGGRPALVPDQAVEQLRGMLQEIAGQGGLPAHGFRPGDVLRFRSGPLQGLLAIFQGPTTPAERVRVLIQFLGQANSAQVELADLERASPLDRAAPLDLASVMDRRDRTGRPPRRTRGRGRFIKGHQPLA